MSYAKYSDLITLDRKPIIVIFRTHKSYRNKIPRPIILSIKESLNVIYFSFYDFPKALSKIITRALLTKVYRTRFQSLSCLDHSIDVSSSEASYTYLFVFQWICSKYQNICRNSGFERYSIWVNNWARDKRERAGWGVRLYWRRAGRLSLGEDYPRPAGCRTLHPRQWRHWRVTTYDAVRPTMSTPHSHPLFCARLPNNFRYLLREMSCSLLPKHYVKWNMGIVIVDLRQHATQHSHKIVK